MVRFFDADLFSNYVDAVNEPFFQDCFVSAIVMSLVESVLELLRRKKYSGIRLLDVFPGENRKYISFSPSPTADTYERYLIEEQSIAHLGYFFYRKQFFGIAYLLFNESMRKIRGTRLGNTVVQTRRKLCDVSSRWVNTIMQSNRASFPQNMRIVSMLSLTWAINGESYSAVDRQRGCMC